MPEGSVLTSKCGKKEKAFSEMQEGLALNGVRKGSLREGGNEKREEAKYRPPERVDSRA